MLFRFDNSYTQLPISLFSSAQPDQVDRPSIAVFNEALAKDLNLNVTTHSEDEIAAYLSGRSIPEGAQPIAQAYAGHQFGGFNKLGDGRAILLGEHITSNGSRVDVQLKGSGITAYSRRGDGKATLSAMLREYLISEAMFALDIPTTRSLAVVKTGEDIQREATFPGAVLTRIASSHIRVGTFEYVRNYLSQDVLKIFTEYTIQRHYSELLQKDNTALALLEKVLHQQVDLIVHWMRVGFIHGVMNTDNMSIAGETIDYGPCAFMNAYHPDTVFSSIDLQGRYAFGNQPSIALWNLYRFAETLLPLIDENTDIAVEKAAAVLKTYQSVMDEKWLRMMANKLGVLDVQKEDISLFSELLNWMMEHKADYTNTFIALSTSSYKEESAFRNEAFESWVSKWENRIGASNGLPQVSRILMQNTNPAYIPRNHKVESALYNAQANDDYKEFYALLAVLSDPYNYDNMDRNFQTLPAQEGTYKTYCGT
jgi:uncharacterized protein YdiU (UPF0061 family)